MGNSQRFGKKQWEELEKTNANYSNIVEFLFVYLAKVEENNQKVYALRSRISKLYRNSTNGVLRIDTDELSEYFENSIVIIIKCLNYYEDFKADSDKPIKALDDFIDYLKATDRYLKLAHKPEPLEVFDNSAENKQRIGDAAERIAYELECQKFKDNQKEYLEAFYNTFEYELDEIMPVYMSPVAVGAGYDVFSFTIYYKDDKPYLKPCLMEIKGTSGDYKSLFVSMNELNKAVEFDNLYDQEDFKDIFDQYKSDKGIGKFFIILNRFWLTDNYDYMICRVYFAEDKDPSEYKMLDNKIASISCKIWGNIINVPDAMVKKFRVRSYYLDKCPTKEDIEVKITSRNYQLNLTNA